MRNYLKWIIRYRDRWTGAELQINFWLHCSGKRNTLIGLCFQFCKLQCVRDNGVGNRQSMKKYEFYFLCTEKCENRLCVSFKCPSVVLEILMSKSFATFYVQRVVAYLCLVDVGCDFECDYSQGLAASIACVLAGVERL